MKVLYLKPKKCERCGYDDATTRPPDAFQDRFQDVCESCYHVLCMRQAKMEDWADGDR